MNHIGPLEMFMIFTLGFIAMCVAMGAYHRWIVLPVELQQRKLNKDAYDRLNNHDAIIRTMLSVQAHGIQEQPPVKFAKGYRPFTVKAALNNIVGLMPNYGDKNTTDAEAEG